MQNITILGGGLMGHGLAQLFAVAGHEVTVFETDFDTLMSIQSRIMANLAELGQKPDPVTRVTVTNDINRACKAPGLIIEAIAENLAAKQALLAQIEARIRPDAIIASNTSVIPITAIMSGLKHKERALGTHFWNPPFLIPLVEVIGTEWTSAPVLAAVMEVMRAAGKTPVHVKKDVPGFIGNRLQNALWREAIYLVEAGICTAEDVDTVVKSSFGRRLSVLGPLENMDLIGTDLTLAIHETIMPALDSRPAPSPLLERMVADGKLGMKSSQGFHAWTDAQKSDVRARLFAELKRALDA